MKVSELFNDEKYREQIKKLKSYGKLMGEELRCDSLENDIGEPGELFDGAKIDLLSRRISLNESKKVKKCYIPSREIVQIEILPGVEIEIKECYMQPLRMSNDTEQEGFNLGRVKELHVGSKLRELNCINDRTYINKIIIHGENNVAGLFGDGYFKYKIARMKGIAKIIYDTDVRYLSCDNEMYVNVTSKLYEQLKDYYGINSKDAGNMTVRILYNGKISVSYNRYGYKLRKMDEFPYELAKDIVNYIARMSLSEVVKAMSIFGDTKVIKTELRYWEKNE